MKYILLSICVLWSLWSCFILERTLELDRLNPNSQILESVLVIKLNNTREKLRVADMRAKYLKYLLDQKRGRK